MKKIMFLESRYDSFYGAQKSMLKLIQSLDNTKFEYKVVTTNIGNFKNEMERKNFKVDVIKLGNKANVFGGKVLSYSIFGKCLAILQIILYNLKLMRYVRSNNIDIIYVNDQRAFLYSVFASKIMKRRNVWYIRTDVSNSKLTRMCFKYCDRIITIAHGVLKEIPEHELNKHKYKISNIYTGFDFEQYEILNKTKSKRKLRLDTSKLTIGYLGSINSRKGIDLLVDSFIELNATYKKTELLLVGDTSSGYNKYWQEQLDKLEKKNAPFKHVTYTNNVDQVLGAMDIFVLPSRAEGLPRVVIEAMGHLVPVIATDVGGVREIIVDKDFGIVIGPDNKKELKHAMEILITNDKHNKYIATKANEYVRGKFSNDKFITNINHFFIHTI